MYISLQLTNFTKKFKYNVEHICEMHLFDNETISARALKNKNGKQKIHTKKG